MARIFDVVEYPKEMADEIVHRFPETGVADLRIGSQVIVRESQNVVSCGMDAPWMCLAPADTPSPLPIFRS